MIYLRIYDEGAADDLQFIGPFEYRQLADSFAVFNGIGEVASYEIVEVNPAEIKCKNIATPEAWNEASAESD